MLDKIKEWLYNYFYWVEALFYLVMVGASGYFLLLKGGLV